MKVRLFRNTALTSLVAFLAFTASSLVDLQARRFTNDNGTVIEAELVSYKAGKVKLKRTDGKEFEIDPSIFNTDDEAYIKNWMSITPEIKNYNFKIAAVKKKMEGNSMNMGYKRVKNDLWSYVITITNGSQDSVSRFTVNYRVLYSNSADGCYSANDEQIRLRIIEGSEKRDAELPFNGKLDVTTTSVQIDTVDYDGAGYRYKDNIKGCIVRIHDDAGNTIFDWVSPEVSMKGKDWLNTNPTERDAKNLSIAR